MVLSAPIDEHAVTQALRMHIRPLRISANVHQPQSQVLHFLSYEMKDPFEVGSGDIFYTNWGCILYTSYFDVF